MRAARQRQPGAGRERDVVGVDVVRVLHELDLVEDAGEVVGVLDVALVDVDQAIGAEESRPRVSRGRATA